MDMDGRSLSNLETVGGNPVRVRVPLSAPSFCPSESRKRELARWSTCRRYRICTYSAPILIGLGAEHRVHEACCLTVWRWNEVRVGVQGECDSRVTEHSHPDWLRAQLGDRPALRSGNGLHEGVRPGAPARPADEPGARAGDGGAGAAVAGHYGVTSESERRARQGGARAGVAVSHCLKDEIIGGSAEPLEAPVPHNMNP
jgi:hypothetical protein